MREIKINFFDFWPGFNKKNNYFYNLLSHKYNVIVDKNPELLFYSRYNSDYLKYKWTRIFYSAEKIRPDFLACDFAFIIKGQIILGCPYILYLLTIMKC